MKSTSREDESVMRTFIGQTRELIGCAQCTSLLLDPVEAKCGHFLCRGCITELLNSSNNEQTHLCGVCQSTISKFHLKELNSKKSKLISSLQQFIQDFCREGGWRIDTFLSSCANVQQNSRSPPLKLEEKEKTARSKTTAADFEEGGDAILISSSSSSKLAHQSTLEPAHKVHQWLMTNPHVDPLAVTSEVGENPNIKSSTTFSKTISTASSKLLLTPVTISSTGKESSYDIVSAPSPPPSREITQQMKRGRGGRGRGRGRQRKNALPISSGETIAKKRGRSTGNTPETKQISAKTAAAQSNFSPEIDGASKTQSIATTRTPLTHSPKPSIEKNSRTDQTQDSQNETRSLVAWEEEMNISVCMGNSCVPPTKEALEKSSNNFTRQVDACEPSLDGLADLRSITPNLEETPRLPQRILANRSNLYPLSPVKNPNLQLDKPANAPFTALHHLTPVSRPKVRNSLGSVLHDLKTFDRDFRRHSISEGLESSTGRRNVNFFHKGRIVPKKSIGSFKKQPIVFTLLGKLGPHPDRSSPCPPILQDSSAHAQKCVVDKETQTLSSSPVSFAPISTPVEPIETTVALAKESPTAHMRVNYQAPILPDNADSIGSQKKSIGEQLQDEEIDKIMLESGQDECSEDAFMFVEPFKRSRVLSSSDSENETMESKRKRPCPSVKSSDADDPISLTSLSKEKIAILEVPQRSDSQQTDGDLACKTVVMESDPDEDDILVATPPHPPLPKPIPCPKKVFTCSGLPRPQVKMIEDWARRIGAEVALTYNSSVTHIIVQLDEENCAQRTLKFLYGVASAKWIVGVDWVHQCIRENRLIDEEPFEALDMDGEDGPRRARQTSQRFKLFEAFEFCCQEPFTDVSVDQLNQLLEMCGATTVKNPAELMKSRRHSMVIVQIDDEISPEVQRNAASWFDRHQVLSVSREWILDCLASYQLLPVRNQLIGKHTESMLRRMGFDSQLLV